MASWLSSKLKAAEQLLNQIDQQAADSLKKPDRDSQEPDPLFQAPIQHEILGSAPHPKIFGDPLVPSNKITYRSPDFAPSGAARSSSSIQGSSTHPEKDDWTEILSAAGNSGDWKRPASREKIQRSESNSRRPRKLLAAPAKRINASKKAVATQEPNSNGLELVSGDKLERKEENKEGESVTKEVVDTKEDLVGTVNDTSTKEDEDAIDPPTSLEQTEEELSACKAAIDERALFVEKLEAEKQALEALLDEREEQQKKEAAELRTSMVELIQAADLEKRRHSHTRMEALERESLLQNESVELAKCLAAAQRKFDAELAGLTDARTKLELKRVSVFELERKASRLRSTLANPSSSFLPQISSDVFKEKQKVADDIDYYKAQVENLQAEIHASRMSRQMQSDKERELESRLIARTDHLIHTQTQVEALSTEKATLIFRLEAYSSQERASKTRNESSDIEFGPTASGDELISWSEISSNLDSLFIQGTRVLGMNRTVRSLAAAYFFLLHLWVVFIIVKHARFLHR
ncbi:golgin candidate 2 [Selaginella moellendorffii]|uniref:golgin candidate 2 n=1 Tax=Selaginella moellendorffii TaxID=88036 RepID=UPI000D1CC05B|nr:golgin candidate 2 [Selaginella moellendorffii]|eukprot:XP_024514880.1 golgin candidate 2 [Selaginella moellendorffii]